MGSLVFITVIFTLFCVFTSYITLAYTGCDGKKNEKRFHHCMTQWTMFKDKRSATSFLTDYYLIEEICQGAVSPEKMDRCIKKNVNPECDAIYAFWQGTNDKYTFICKWRKEFFNHFRCRTNRLFTNDVGDCHSSCKKKISAGADYCQSARVLRKCLFHTLERHCSADAWEFFKIVFDSELAPPMKYMNCREDFYSPNAVSSIDSVEVKKKELNKPDVKRDQRVANTKREYEREISASVQENYPSDILSYTSKGNNIFSTSLVVVIVTIHLAILKLM